MQGNDDIQRVGSLKIFHGSDSKHGGINNNSYI